MSCRSRGYPALRSPQVQSVVRAACARHALVSTDSVTLPSDTSTGRTSSSPSHQFQETFRVVRADCKTSHPYWEPHTGANDRQFLMCRQPRRISCPFCRGHNCTTPFRIRLVTLQWFSSVCLQRTMPACRSICFPRVRLRRSRRFSTFAINQFVLHPSAPLAAYPIEIAALASSPCNDLAPFACNVRCPRLLCKSHVAPIASAPHLRRLPAR